jgi:hypothetical protein
VSIQVKLGEVIQHEGTPWRVVRIVTHDYSLFEEEGIAGNRPSQPPYTLEESYIMLKDVDGKVDFIVLSSNKKPYEGEPSPIKALKPIVWRKES